TCPPEASYADKDTDDTRPKCQERQEPQAHGVRMRVGPKTDCGRAYDEEQRPTPTDEETKTHLHEARLQVDPHQASSVTRWPNAGPQPHRGAVQGSACQKTHRAPRCRLQAVVRLSRCTRMMPIGRC